MYLIKRVRSLDPPSVIGNRLTRSTRSLDHAHLIRSAHTVPPEHKCRKDRPTCTNYYAGHHFGRCERRRRLQEDSDSVAQKRAPSPLRPTTAAKERTVPAGGLLCEVLRNPLNKSLMVDLTAASNLFIKSSRLVEFLLKGNTLGNESASGSASKPTAQTFAPGFGAIQDIPKRMEAMWVSLYECGHVQAADVRAWQLWLKVLLSKPDGYTFPTSLEPSHTNSGDGSTSRTTVSGGCNLAKMTTCSQKLAASGMTDACKLAKVSLACFSDECKSGAYRAVWTTAETTAKTACASATGGGGTLIGTSGGGAGSSSSASHVPANTAAAATAITTMATSAATTAITTPATNPVTATDTPTTLTTPHPKFDAVGVNPWIDATEQHCSRAEMNSADTSISDLCACVEEFAAKYKHCTALGDDFFPIQFAGAAVNNAKQVGGVVYQVLPMPSYLDAAMLLWRQHNNGGPDVASDFDTAADMRRSKARFLRDVFLTNTNSDNTSIAFDCRSLRMVWTTRAMILESNDDVVPPCYDTCISARDGKCDELRPTRVNGNHIHTTRRQAEWACAPGTDGSDCGCVQPRGQTSKRGQQIARRKKRSGLGRGASGGVGGDSTAKQTTLQIWSNDYHTGLVSDLKHFLPRFVAPKLGSDTHTVHIEWLDRSFSSYCALQKPPTCAITGPSKLTREKNAKAQVTAAAAATTAKAKVAVAQTAVTIAATAAAAAKAAVSNGIGIDQANTKAAISTAAEQALKHAIQIERVANATAVRAAKVKADGEASAAKATIHGLNRDTAWNVSIRVSTAPLALLRALMITNSFVGLVCQ